MADALVSAGLPKPWMVHAKEIPGPGFISGCFAPSSPENSSAHRFAPYTSCRDVSRSSTSHQKRSSRPRRKGKIQCLSADMENMSHAQSIEHHPSASGFSYIPEQIILPCQADLATSNPDFMTTSVMKSTLSCNSVNNMPAAGPLNYSMESCPAPTATTTTRIPSMLTADPAWAAKANSFVSAIEDTPSVSSSFDLVDLRKEEVPVYHDLPFYSHDDASDAANKFQGSHLDYPALSLGLPLGYNEASWGMCSAQDPNPWRQPYIENADEQVWTSGEYFPTGWPGIGSHGSTVLTKSPGIQSYEPYQLIHLSSLDHHPDLRHPSTPIPSESDTEHTNPLPRALETSINIHSYQEYPNINPISQDPHSSQLPSATNYNHPPIPPPPPTQPIQHIASPEEPVGIKASLHYSDSRNAFLISCKQRGLSYKDIKRIGGFKEAESTLRGRFRTLTKTKEQRVRKPKWLDRDINLLCEAVTIYTEPNLGVMPYGTLGSDQPPKVSWKKVAQHIWTHGGSYEFGNATCKKKWCEIHDIKT